MSTDNTRYTSVAIFLHWTMAALILGLIAVGLTMEDFPQSIRGHTYALHKSLGLTVLALSLVRLAWRLSHRAPPLPATLAGWERFTARAVHVAFYLLMIGMPFSGWLFVSAFGKYPTILFWLVNIPHLPIPEGINVKALGENARAAHYWLAMGTLALLALHVGAAAKHHFMLRDGVVQRMLPLRWQRR